MTETNRIIYITTGTVGDVAPFMAHAKQSQAHGLDVVLLSNSNHRSLSERHGIPFGAISEPDWDQYGRDEAAFFSNVILPGYERAFEYLEESLSAGTRPRIFGRTGNWAAQFICERYELPYTRIALQPCAIRQAGHPVSVEEHRLLNRLRERMGLAVLPSADRIPETIERTLSFFPHWFGAPQSEWAESGQCVGFMYLDDDSYAPDAELDAFISRRRPIVVSLGTGTPSPQVFDALIERIAIELSYPVVFLGPSLRFGSHPRPENIIHRTWADHRYLLARAGLLIHNGGIGAVAQAIRARIPQIVVPLVWDQPDNGARVERLGLGRCIAPLDAASHETLLVIGRLLAANSRA
jgi:rhamnosyltransferase subunit B